MVLPQVDHVGRARRPPRSSAARRAQAARAEARTIDRIVRAFQEVQAHRGNTLSKLAQALSSSLAIASEPAQDEAISPSCSSSASATVAAEMEVDSVLPPVVEVSTTPQGNDSAYPAAATCDDEPSSSTADCLARAEAIVHQAWEAYHEADRLWKASGVGGMRDLELARHRSAALSERLDAEKRHQFLWIAALDDHRATALGQSLATRHSRRYPDKQLPSRLYSLVAWQRTLVALRERRDPDSEWWARYLANEHLSVKDLEALLSSA